MENKKNLKVNCGVCDVRGIKEELLAAYEKVRINCGHMITSPAAQVLLSKYAAGINAGYTTAAEGVSPWLMVPWNWLPARRFRKARLSW